MTHKIITQNTFDDSLTQYGDGIFETMLAVGGGIHHWDYHWQRLESSCQRLQITVPERGVLEQQLQSALFEQNHVFSVVKMIIARGEGLRGYRSHVKQPCSVQFRISPYQFNPTLYQGLTVRICHTRLSYQPLLAGMKHCNRLEYVMARREPQDTQFDEGLLFDSNNELIEGLISNIFLVKNKKILTPELSGSGVAGTMRAYLLAWLPTQGYSVEMTHLGHVDLLSADSIFLTNATNGIMPVLTIQGIEKVFDKKIVEIIRQQAEHPSCRVC